MKAFDDMKRHLVIALDPSYAALGWARVFADGQPEVIASGAMSYSHRKAKAEEKFPGIIRDFGQILDEWLSLYEAQQYTVAIEHSWHGKNAATASKLAELRGGLLAVALCANCKILRVTPREWQVASDIPMRADRAMVKRMSRAIALRRTGKLAMSEDEADAINIGVCAAGVVRIGDLA